MNGKSGRIALKAGVTIRYKKNIYDTWNTVTIISKAGKATGRFKNYYNVENNYKKYYLDLDKVYKYERVSIDSDRTDIEEDLKQNWVKLGSPISFAGISKIYHYYNKQIKIKDIERALSTIPTYSKFKQRKANKVYNPFFIYHLHQQWQLDLTYLQHLKGSNDNISYLLVVIECFSRKIFVSPMEDKSSSNVLSHFRDIHSYISRTPESIYVDKGSEFNSAVFRSYCSNNGIKLIFSHSLNKASLVERSQRTLQGIMFKYMDYYETPRYINFLDEIVSTFNSKTNRTIQMTPNDAYNQRNHNNVMKNLEMYYIKALNNKKRSRYSTGDKVRIFKISKEGAFKKEYNPAFSEEIFIVHRVDKRLPQPRYFLKDGNDEEIIGSFQAHELSVVRV